jgi:hypothetical protein
LPPLYRACADDLAFADRAQKESPIAVGGLRAVDVRQARIDEIPCERIWVMTKMFMPNGFNLKTAVRLPRRSAWFDFRVLIASGGCEAGRSSQQAAFQEGLEGARQDRAPFLRSRQLLRIFEQTPQEGRDSCECARRGLRLRV